MSTIADLLFKAVQLLTGERARLRALKRDQQDRIADYLQEIADGLQRAAEKFAAGKPPYAETRECVYHAGQLLSVIGRALGDETFALYLKSELERAIEIDRAKFGVTEDEQIQRALAEIAIHEPSYYEHPYFDHRGVSQQKVAQILADEYRKIEETAGLFHAAAAELRARAT